MLRSHTCNDLRPGNAGQQTTLAGWVHRRRDHGGIIFIDLRDHYGLTQIVFDPAINPDAHAQAEHIRPEWVVQITGAVQRRKPGMENAHMATGEIEVFAEALTVLNRAETPPFEIDSDAEVNEELRLTYRYLDLRKARMQRNLRMRHQILRHTRAFFDSQHFTEIETPCLVKGTPEGAREYLVPSRLYPGEFYVLPQSPQQMKQLLMVAGMDRYYQVARCFRDEDLRGDRQPEFTQLDMEMSFVEQEDILHMMEQCFLHLTEQCVPERNYKAFLEGGRMRRMTWQQAMSQYGTDKPDLRYDMRLYDITSIVAGSGFSVFASAQYVTCMRVPGGAEFSRSYIDRLTQIAKEKGAGGLAYITVESDGTLKSPILKFLSDTEQAAIVATCGAQPGDILFFGAESFQTACGALGAVRVHIAKDQNLTSHQDLAYVIVTDFPLMEINDEGKRDWAHHPFTMPHPEDIAKLDDLQQIMTAKAWCYDFVLNGYELGSGSIRVHDPALQKKIFQLLQLSDEEIEAKFGHILRAFAYGCPPHGGYAFGVDRVAMIFADEPNIREVIAFPKTLSAKDLMFSAPSPMPADVLAEQNIRAIPRD
ncbi:aspartate--tRNA ligase [Candidatus Peribacteria bacterium]|nr:aspartate--tRNA ligase [Candidatus Peribacteria bacterium]